MKKQYNIKADNIMKELDNWERRSPEPYFMTRLQARLQKEKEVPPKKTEALLSFLQLRAAIAALILIFNLITIALAISNIKPENNRDENIQIMAEEYTIDTYNLNY